MWERVEGGNNLGILVWAASSAAETGTYKSIREATSTAYHSCETGNCDAVRKSGVEEPDLNGFPKKRTKAFL